MIIKFGKGVINVFGQEVSARIHKDPLGHYAVTYWSSKDKFKMVDHSTYYTETLNDAIDISVSDIKQKEGA